MNLKKYDSISELKSEWDENFKTNSLDSHISLETLEKSNPCGQRYFTDKSGGFIVSYRLKLNLFTFKRPMEFKLPVNIVGLPFSVSKQGYSSKHIESFIRSSNGLNLVLNSKDALNLPKGETLPSCIFHNRFESFNEYLNSLRSHYRYRIKKALKKSSCIDIKKLKSNLEFDVDLYDLYLEVFNNSNEKLECLPIDFFRSYPSEIFVFSKEDKKIGFVQLCKNNDELVFLFGGFKKDLNRSFDLYLKLLLFIIEYGIEKRFKRIDFGQTAEESKLKLGCKLERRFMYVHHSNRILNSALKLLVPLFSYRAYKHNHNIFKEEENEDTSREMPCRHAL